MSNDVLYKYCFLGKYSTNILVIEKTKETNNIRKKVEIRVDNYRLFKNNYPVRLAGGRWLMLICSGRKIPLTDWWLVAGV
jgi:hypothetical protein